jgi:hypothetical protein
MFIWAQGGQTYARLQFRAGPGGVLRIPVRVEYGLEFDGSDHEAWEAEYDVNVSAVDAACPKTELASDFEFPWEMERPSIIGNCRDLLMPNCHKFYLEDCSNGPRE